MSIRIGIVLLLILLPLSSCRDELRARKAAIREAAAMPRLPAGTGHDSQASPRGPDENEAPLQAAARSVEQGEHDKAISILRRAAKAQGDSLEIRLLTGATLLDKGELKKAKEHLMDTVAVWPGSAKARLLLGYTLFALNEHREAVVHFEETLRLTEDREQLLAAHLGLASLAEKRGDRETAGEHYARAIAIDPTLPKALVFVQKELLWSRPTPGQDGGFGDAGQDRARRQRIEAELAKIGGNNP